MIRRVVDVDGNLKMSQKTGEEFLWDGNELFAKRGEVTGLLHYYVYNPATGELLFDNPSYADGAGLAYATLTDHLGTIHDLVNKRVVRS
jgi:hypothetical protein